MKETAQRTASSRLDTSTMPRGPLNWIFFPLALLYHELLLRAFDTQNAFFRGTLVMVVLFSIATGLLLSLLVNLLHNRRLAQVLTLVVTALWTLLLCVEYCCRSYFKSYFSVGFICTMTGNVVTGFGSTIPGIVAQRLPFIIAALLPLALCILLRKRIVTEHRMSKWSLLFVTAVSVIFLLIGEGLARWGTYGDSYTYNFQTDAAVSQFGLHTAVRLEAEYALFGTPQPKLELPTQEDEPGDPPAATTPVEYGYNALDIDFQALADSASDSTLRNMAQYFGSLTPSKKNEYTGLFQGKNLVLITAEAFSPWFISRELTPTLYKLTHEGFVCENYYQPGWGQSTTGGEYAVMTGLLPTWVGSNVSFYASANDDMPFALGNQLRALGYRTGAYHDNIYNYYNRDKTHPNLGYDYQGVGSGLTVTEDGSWPYSDLEMVQNTIGDYIDGYVSDGTPFHVYYMTVSGHGSYGWGHAMAAKNRAKAQAAYPNASTQVQSYVAANLELENALTYLLEQLEAAGIAEDTVICMSADHYPYLLAEPETDYYNELRGVVDSERDTDRYRNALVLWCGGMENAVTVTEPCSAVDIVPTLSNLFGLEYDSRLLSGRDVLDKDYDAGSASGSIPLVILPTSSGNSWATAAGVFEASTRTFNARPGVTVEEDYVSRVNNIVALQYNYAQQLIARDYYRVALGRE
ncbi:MAG: LTA synthase family protein [Clostridiales bacterium]|nr:LTA synthase family protein [Clostridiales bacterium]